MYKYWLVFKLSIQDVFEYRLDFFLHTFKYAMMVILMALVWIAVARASDEPLMTQSETVTYFFLAAMVYSLSNFHTFYIEDDIRLGALSKYLLKPISAFQYYLSYEAGRSFLETGIKIVVMGPLLLFFSLQLELELLPSLVFLLFLPLIFVYAFNQFSFISGLAFWLQEAYALRWGASIIFRFLAGLLVPLSFFPVWAQHLSFYLPFQHLAYTPIQLLLGNISLNTAFSGLAILAVWTVLLATIRHRLWALGYHQYESIGM